MVKNLDVLALIPARGGSKGIPRKNIRDFGGCPLIAYSIVAGLRAETVTRVIVSTDDEEIACVARQWGAEVPFLRPAELARDDTPDYPVFRHALDWLAAHEGYVPEVVVQLRPTSPVRPRTCIDDAVRLLLEHPDADCVRGVVPSGQNPFKMWTLEAGSGRMLPLLHVEGLAEPYNSPRQSLPKTFWQTGHIDAIRTRTILDKGSLTGDVVLPLQIDPRYTVDIDVLADWERYARLIQDHTLQYKQKLKLIKLAIFDIDGVFTDGGIYCSLNGEELLKFSRVDGKGIELIKEMNIIPAVISSENSPIAEKRMVKLQINEIILGADNKLKAYCELRDLYRLSDSEICFCGDDVQDSAPIEKVGFSACPQNAVRSIKERCDYVSPLRGGEGFVREICDMLSGAQNEEDSNRR